MLAAYSLRSWRDSCARGTFLAKEPPCEVSGEAARENPPGLQIDLYTHPSRGSTAKTITHTLIPPATQATSGQQGKKERQ